MQIIDTIPVEFNITELSRQLHIAPGSEDAADLQSLLDQAARVAHPKAVYQVAYIEGRAPDTVTLQGVTFTSRVLAANLSTVERVFPYIATCGAELDTVPVPAGDMLKRFWLDAIKLAAMRLATAALFERLDREFVLGHTVHMNPGSGDADVWPIEQQRQLFSLFGDVQALIGVRLTESCLMVPNKTVSGIYYPTQVDFQTCQLCRRENCPGRAAPYDPALEESYHRR